MTRIRYGAAVLGLALMVPSGVSGQSEGFEVGPAIGTPAPGAELEDLDGNSVQILDYVGDGPALIEFWAVWCGNCLALQPQIQQIQTAYGDQIDIVAVAVAVSQTREQVKEHVDEHDPGYPYLWDGSGAAVRAYEASTTSVIVLLDEDGKVAYTGVGSGQDVVAAVERLLGDR